MPGVETGVATSGLAAIDLLVGLFFPCYLRSHQCPEKFKAETAKYVARQG